MSDNSWRTNRNYDAAWVFVKYAKNSGVTWEHATLKTAGKNPASFSQGTGSSIDVVVPNDLYGAFIQRSSEGHGTIDTDNIQLVWDYDTDGLTDNDAVVARVYGIEMVYVAEGAFYAGDTSSTASFQQGNSDTDPWYVDDTEAISVTNAASNGYYYATDSSTYDDASGSTFTIPALFPNGYDAFYMMKHEMSQAMYRDFLNALDYPMQETRTEDVLSTGGTNFFAMSNNAGVQDRQVISYNDAGGGTDIKTFGADLDDGGSADYDETTDGEWIAMNYISYMDLVAFADWAALRPLTELEFEKAARGKDQTQVAAEYVWGSSTITDSVTTGESLQSSGEAGELAPSDNMGMHGLSNYDSDTSNDPDGPMRVGYQATSTSNRLQAAAGYYGALNLNDNLQEVYVTVGNSTGRAFEGTHGDGELITTSSYEGNATNTDWPGIDNTTNRGVTSGAGAGMRGGEWAGGAGTVSKRTAAANQNNADARGAIKGGRVGRTAPLF
jgi:formylglycine-generating enzyme required for sulfatase activity